MIEVQTGNSVRHMANNPHMRDEAYRVYNQAVDDGLLVRPDACTKCGRSDVQIDGHHADYLYPLRVDWLCGECHQRKHWPTPARQRKSSPTPAPTLDDHVERADDPAASLHVVAEDESSARLLRAIELVMRGGGSVTVNRMGKSETFVLPGPVMRDGKR